MRPANEIDFWRGFALVTIFINHIPGLFFERFTFRNLSISDSAELFVFLAGYAMRSSLDGAAAKRSGGWLFLRLEARAFNVYAAQMIITEIAIALLAAGALLLDAPFLLDWHNAYAVFHDPVRAHIGLMLMTHQLGYFNILPLYVVLMFVAPVVVLIHRATPAAVMPISFLVYIVALGSGVNFPTWPVEGRWFFNPLAWQFIFVLGFLLAGESGIAAFARRYSAPIRAVAFVIVLVGAIAVVNDVTPSLEDVPAPKLFFVFDKTFLSPSRLIHALALIALFAGSFRVIGKELPRIAGFLSALGRNSLNVFCVGSLLSLIGQIFRFIYGDLLIMDTVILVSGVFFLGITAWISEWRARLAANLADEQ